VTLRRAGFVVAAALVVLLAWWAARWAVVSANERETVLTKACADAAALRHAHLLDEAIAEYSAISRADRSFTCPRERSDAYAQTARAWQDELDWDSHTSAQYAEQGAVYFRAFLVKSGRTDRAGRLTARARARRAYLVALYIDPGAAEARRDLGDVLAAFGTPTKAPAADQRCDMAGDVFEAGLLPEARMAYAQALRSGRTTQCAKRGVRTIRQWRADAMTPLREARSQRAAGRLREARESYIQAYTMDSSLTEAKQALAHVPAPSLAGARSWPHAKHDGEQAAGTIKDVGTWIKDNPDSSGLAATVIVLVALLLMALLLRAARNRHFHRLMKQWSLLDRFTHMRVDVEPFEDPEGQPARPVTAVFVEALSKRLLTPDGHARGEKSDVDATTDVAPAAGTTEVDDWIAATPSLAGFAVLLRWLSNVAPRNEVRVHGHLLEPAERGAGLRLEVFTRRGRPLKSRQFWHQDVLPGGADDDAVAYRDLARYAAPWVRDRKAP
jgi:tetratricopeptide (TPR) repeat protein